MKVKIEQVINSYMIKYDRLIPCIQRSLGRYANAQEVNIYLDIYPIIKSIYRQDCEITNYNSICSCVLNICGHYREFFRNTCNVRSNIYIVFSQNCPYINKQFYKNYNYVSETMFKSDTVKTDMIKFNLELLSLLSKYLYKIYYVPTTFESGVMIYDLIMRNRVDNKNIPDIVISKDPYLFQLAPIKDNIVILRPLKSDGRDNSYYVNIDNVMNTFLKVREVKKRTDILMPGLLTLIMTLSSVKERNIKTMCNVTKAINLLEKAIGDYKILNGYNSNIDDVWNNIENSTLKVSDVEFKNRFKCIDIPFQHQVFYNTPECKLIKEYLVDLNDPKTLNGINVEYFDKNPLNFERLCY